MITGLLRRQYGWFGARLYRKYVLIIGLLVAGALLFSGGLNIFFTYQDKLDSISDLEREKAYFAASNIESFMGDVQNQLERATQVEYEDSDAGIAAREADYLALANRVPAITELGYWNSAGQERFMMAQFGRETFTSDSPLSVEDILAGAKSAGIFNGPVYFDNDSVQHMTIGISESGSGSGVLIAEVNLNLLQVIISKSSLNDAGLVYVVDANGFIVAHPSQEYVSGRTNVFHLPQVQSAIKNNSSNNSPTTRASIHDNPVTIEKDLDGKSVLATSLPVSNLGWSVLIEHPQSEAFASLQAPIIRSSVLLIVGLVLAIFISLLLAKKMVAPVVSLRNAVNELNPQPIDPESQDDSALSYAGDELASLGSAFVLMSDQINEAHSTLESRVEQRTEELVLANNNLESEIAARQDAEKMAFMLQRAMEYSPNAVLITDTQANIEYVNLKFSEVTGYTSDEIIGKQPSILQSGRTSREKYQRLWETVTSGGEWSGELYNKRKDGKFYWSSEKILPIKDTEGKITHYLAVEQDVTEQKKAEEEAKVANQGLADLNRTLEQMVNERTSDLQQANNRLIEAHDQLVRTEKLAAIGELSAGVAHDLRNPLGAIKNAIYYLNAKLATGELAKENPRIPEFLRIIDEEVGNSNRIITDLMDFARISSPTFSPADLGTLVQDCLGKLELNEGVYVNIQDGHHEDLMQVQADGRQLHRVFQNLIQNAQDAMPDGGVITVSIKEEGGFAAVSISDTGEGIKHDFLDKIFDPLFTTKTKGTGLGLAVCQQIVSKHGGLIEVKSRQGVGAMFKVRLPISAHHLGADQISEAEVIHASP
ncbi:MAG: PAS domain S-box protein [Chloroflexi bacterium]|nr:PAS domain S-box protein [Chloroflexota bacterium]